MEMMGPFSFARMGSVYAPVAVMVLFIWLIIRLIRLVFSAGTVFFSHKKLANSIFQPAYNSSRTTPMS
jgi:IS4 transposase